MSIVRNYINEKFSEDSDPIHDMGIGYTPINFETIRSNCRLPEGDLDDLRKWLSYLDTLTGKTIYGKFLDIDGIIMETSEFKIYNRNSRKFGLELEFLDENEKRYKVIFGEIYLLRDK